ncbi:MAG: hypothetical protein PHN44_00200 [Candidatus Marinimicrobia bacterium]|nr:hypothetical protein [Candidatus Neomarinimicrobiota bacterium]
MKVVYSIKDIRELIAKKHRKSPESVIFGKGATGLCYSWEMHGNDVAEDDPLFEIEVSSRSFSEKKLPDWKIKCETFEDYLSWELEEFKKISHDTIWIAERTQYHPRLNITQTLTKAHLDFWSTPAGWKNIKSRRGDTVDWKSTWANALTMRCNQVWLTSFNQNTQQSDDRYSPL